MRKFIISTLKGDTAIMEVECELISSLEDPSVMWLPPGEFKIKITAPKELLTKKMVGKDTILEPTIYYNHSIFSSEEEAIRSAHQLIRKTIELRCIKHKTEFKEEDVLAEFVKIKKVKL